MKSYQSGCPNKKALTFVSASKSKINSELFLFVVRNVRQVLSTAPNWRIGGSSTRDRNHAPAVDATCRKPFAVNGLDQDPSYLLGKCSMFGSRASAKRFLQFIRNICSDKHTFTICHVVDVSPE